MSGSGNWASDDTIKAKKRFHHSKGTHKGNEKGVQGGERGGGITGDVCVLRAQLVAHPEQENGEVEIKGSTIIVSVMRG